MEGEEFAPWGAFLLVVSLFLLGCLVLALAVSARGGGPPRNFATADEREMRSVIWTSEATWEAAHRASAPLLFAAAAGLFAAAAVSVCAVAAVGAARSMTVNLGALLAALFWTICCCVAAGERGRIAARRVLRDSR